MIGTTVSHYRITERLGGGGMGVVYKAEDTTLRRTVALKFLPESLTLDPEAKARFKHEAEIASALDHPNICTIYAIEESDAGQRFIAMAFYPGETLEKKIARGPLLVRNAVEIALQTAHGLQAAHDAGMVHRDVKPANIMVSDKGEVKILDFGLAKLSGRTVLTKSGSTPGTVAYMSPEQAKGEALDSRTDIWSLGVVLYEMLAGQRPFRGDYEQAVIYQALNAEPEPVGALRPDTPPLLQEIVARALRKNPEERYQQMGEMHAALKQLHRDSGPTPPPSPPLRRAPLWKSRGARITTIVVLCALLAYAGFRFFARPSATIESVALLPFVNATGDSTLDYLCDGLTETLINRFSQLSHLRVIARTTAFSYKGKAQDPETVGRELNVHAVLTGRIVERGEMLTIQADLVDTHEGTQLWGERYNRKIGDMLALQEEIAGRISDRLRLKLSGEEQSRLTRSYTQDTEAYQLYLKGRYWSDRLSDEGFRKGVEYFNRAIERDPGYALAYAGMADAYYWASTMYLPPKVAMAKSRDAALQALAADSLLAEAHLSYGLVKMSYDLDWEGAEREFRRAVELNPGLAPGHLWLGKFLTWMGRFPEAEVEIQQALTLDPLSPFINIETGFPAYFQHRYTVALENARRVSEANPSFFFAHYVLGDQYTNLKEYPRAIAEASTALRMEDSPVVLAGLGRAYAAAGEKVKADSVIGELIKRPYPPPMEIAQTYAAMGDVDAAMAWLQRALDERSDGLVGLKHDPRLDPLRSDARYKALLRRLRLDN